MDKDPFSQRILLETDPCPYLVRYSLDVLKKKTKVFDIGMCTDIIWVLYKIKSSRDINPFSRNKRIRLIERKGSNSNLPHEL